MSIRIFQVDAFADDVFSGNPAAVCILSAPRAETWMQALAAEMNLSETAFLVARDDGSYDLRWFTPAVEVDLCGHATLASAHILWETGVLAAQEEARFHTRSGLLTANKRDDLIEMDFPATPAETTQVPTALSEALGALPLYVGMSKFDYLVEMASEELVRELNPDMAKLSAFPVRGIIVTAAASSAKYDFVSRFFAPAVGVDEDPVTGSAHACLGPFWSARLGKDEMLAYQASARGGEIHVRVAGERVLLGGQAVTVLHGTLTS